MESLRSAFAGDCLGETNPGRASGALLSVFMIGVIDA